jgi:hypothetical protein
VQQSLQLGGTSFIYSWLCKTFLKDKCFDHCVIYNFNVVINVAFTLYFICMNVLRLIDYQNFKRRNTICFVGEIET